MGQIYDKFPTSAVEFRKFASLAERDRARAGYARDLPEPVSGSGEKTVADLNLCKDWGGLFRRLRPHLFLALSLKERAGRPRGENDRESDFFAGRRPARSHCEKRGGSGGAGASARSGCAKSVVFCARSASAGDDTRGFSPCLTFWYFWVKPKVRRKNSCRLSVCARIGQLASQALARVFFRSFFRRKSQRRPRGENGRESAAHLAERSRKTTLFRTIVPSARCAAASSSDIFTSRDQAGQRPAENK